MPTSAYKITTPTATTITRSTLWKVRSWRWSLLKKMNSTSFPDPGSNTLGQMWVSE